METIKKVKTRRTRSDPRAAALARALRSELRVTLDTVGAGSNLDWSTISNFETSNGSLSEKAERRVLMYYAQAFAAKGYRMDEVPEDVPLADLRLLLVRLLHSLQMARLTLQTNSAAEVSGAARLGESDFIDRVIVASLEGAGGREDSVGVNERVKKRIEEAKAAEQAAAAVTP